MAYNNPRDSESRNKQANYHDDNQRSQRPQGMIIKEPTPCNVTANLFKYTGKNIVLHQYAVTFEPEILKKNVFSKSYTIFVNDL